VRERERGWGERERERIFQLKGKKELKSMVEARENVVLEQPAITVSQE
jgi:hypothetical protein